MSIRLIALDLDDTLLDSQKRLPERNKRALEACIAHGIFVVPCTGRIAIGIPDEILKLQGIRYAITVNGGTLTDLREDRILDERLLSSRTAAEICRMTEAYHVMCDAYINGAGYSNRRCYENMDEYGLPPVVQELIRRTRTPIDSVKDYIVGHNCKVDKLNLFFADQEERGRLRSRLMEREDVLVSSSFPNNLEINALEASKGEGIRRLAKILGLKKEETMAFGDGENDLSIIGKVGISVAMENGDERLKQLADYTAPCNNEAGVAQMIEKLVLSSLV